MSLQAILLVRVGGVESYIHYRESCPFLPVSKGVAMHPEGWKPFVDTLKSPGNLVMAGLAILVLVDLLLGNPVLGKLVVLQLKAFGQPPTGDTIALKTVFGTFTSVSGWAGFVAKFLIGFLLLFPVLSWLRGLYAAVSGK